VQVSARRVAAHLSLPEQPTVAQLTDRQQGGAEAVADESHLEAIGGNQRQSEADDPPEALVEMCGAVIGWPTAIAGASTTTSAPPQPASSSATSSQRQTRGAVMGARLLQRVGLRVPVPAKPADAQAAASSQQDMAIPRREMTIPLRDTTLTVRAGELVAVTGGVGCGKSTLLSACWGESLLLEGSLRVHGDLAMVLTNPIHRARHRGLIMDADAL
jgi:ATPase subunit of ABC transporter with duplicated ATPase domains